MHTPFLLLPKKLDVWEGIPFEEQMFSWGAFRDDSVIMTADCASCEARRMSASRHPRRSATQNLAPMGRLIIPLPWGPSTGTRHRTRGKVFIKYILRSVCCGLLPTVLGGGVDPLGPLGGRPARPHSGPNWLCTSSTAGWGLGFDNRLGVNPRIRC